MRTITLPTGYEIEVRGLKRKELKTLKEFGYHRSRPVLPSSEDAPEDVDDLMDAAIETVLTEADLAALDDVEPRYTSEVWLGIIRETYGAGDEEKNSSTGGDGSPTGKNATTAATAS